MARHIRNVSKTYPNVAHAPKDVTLAIPAGIYSLLGPDLLIDPRRMTSKRQGKS